MVKICSSFTYSRPGKERVRVSSRRRVDDRSVPERQHYVFLSRVTGHLCEHLRGAASVGPERWRLLLIPENSRRASCFIDTLYTRKQRHAIFFFLLRPLRLLHNSRQQAVRNRKQEYSAMESHAFVKAWLFID